MRLATTRSQKRWIRRCRRPSRCWFARGSHAQKPRANRPATPVLASVAPPATPPTVVAHEAQIVEAPKPKLKEKQPVEPAKTTPVAPPPVVATPAPQQQHDTTSLPAQTTPT